MSRRKRPRLTSLLTRSQTAARRILTSRARTVLLVLAVLAVLGSAVVWSLIDPVMTAIYLERAPRWANELISNREKHDLARYQADARALLGPVLADTATVGVALAVAAFVRLDPRQLLRDVTELRVTAAPLRRAVRTWLARHAVTIIAVLPALVVIAIARPGAAVLLVGGVVAGALLAPRLPLMTAGPTGAAALQSSPGRILRALPVIGVGVIAAALLLHRLDSFDFREDEFQVINAAYSLAMVGDYAGWDWIEDRPAEGVPYTRAFPHTWLIARIIEVFGMSEGVTRLPGVLAGTLLVVGAFLLLRRMVGSGTVAALGPLLVLTAYASIFRYARMYALVIPLAVLWTVVHARALTLLPVRPARALVWAGASAACGILGALLHVNMLSLAAAFAIPTMVVVHRFALERLPRGAVLAMWGATGAVVAAGTFVVLDEVDHFFSFFGRRSYAYVTILLDLPVPTRLSSTLGAVLIGVGIGAAFRARPGTTTRWFLLLSTGSLAFALPFFVLIADRYVASVYVSHVRILMLILAAVGVAVLVRAAPRRFVGHLLTVGVTALILLQWQGMSAALYESNTRYGRYSEAYPLIAAEIDVEQDVILGQMFRGYYAQDSRFDGASVLSLGRNRSVSVEDYLEMVGSRPRAWVTWEARKSYHLRPEVIRHALSEGRQVSGPGVDASNIYVVLVETPTN
jgi:hypothetical protein